MLVGIDIGTQSLKAVVTTDDLEVRGEAVRPYGTAHPRPGWAQQDPEDWERALAPAIAEALARAGARATDVAALGIAGQLDGCVAVAADGEPMGPCLIWMDRRSEAELSGIDPERVLAVAGLVMDAGHMAAKIRWLSRRAVGLDGAHFHQPVSYLVERLTGERVYDHGLASTTMLYSLGARDHEPELLDAFGISASVLPRIADAASLAGVITVSGAQRSGLPAGTPVAVGTGDDFATPLGAGIVAPGTIACVLGTAEVVGALSRQVVLDPRGLVETHAYPGGLYFVENPGWMSGGALTWLRDVLGMRDFAALDAAAAGAPSGCDGLTFVPALSGAMAPEWIASARACFCGLVPSHGPGHFARAVMEGCAFAMYDVAVRIRELGLAADSILLAGGGIHSELASHLRADLCGLPVDVAPRADTCAVGAAMLGALAGGLQPDLTTAAGLVSGARTRIEPRAEHRDALAEAHDRYRRLFDALRPLWGTQAAASR